MAMVMLWITLSLLFFLSLCIVIAYICYRMAFYSPNRTHRDPDSPDLPSGKEYEPFFEDMKTWVLETKGKETATYQITSYDGLTLYGHYYEFSPSAPIELMFHGYRGSAERDLSGGVHRCFQLGHSAFVVEQRASGLSEGNVITFGIKEHRDCLRWVDFLVETFGTDIKIILTGISMGASTVLMAAGNPLPNNVIGVLADCGYTSAREIIKIVIRKMGLPPHFCYPFVRLGARVFGKFCLEETSAAEALANCNIPVLFIHGEDDNFVPCYMSRTNYDACSGKKEILIIPGAGHGLSYPVSPKLYLDTMRKFFGC